ncbi:hypothetical protein FYK55_06985 [Roseiconus nitratireducens]|uniref:Uncharacterized protein n=1 Tax=Roseiconus nitratireducens TaxID=2605748 RepID=A0A5M6DGQ8_9BACT|nr:hypothetical protein [Roseiconus nitratireducens]KAA5545389.1 hypothetical protein FYK55_06985 [Roseiconus nitratireducens]
MRNALFAVIFTAIVVGGFLLTGVQAEAPIEAESQIVTIVYKVSDLPVFTGSKQYSPKMLMSLIQLSVSPRDWEREGGRSMMAPYPQNVSLIISTTQENHRKIAALLESFRD